MPPNGQSNTVCPVGTSSNGFKTETVQSSLLEKGEQQDTISDEKVKLVYELAKQLTEGKIEFPVFVQKFQATIGTINNKPCQNLTQ